MRDNTVMTESQTEIYTSAVLQAFDEYVHSLDDEDQIYKTSGFNGAIKYIYIKIFKPDRPQMFNTQSKIDTSDIALLNDLWDCYTMLCHKYGHRPTLIRFSIMIGVSMETFNSWDRMEWRNKSSQHSDSIKRWRKEAENALVDGASESNSIGSIFLLKANFNYRETAPILPEEYSQASHDTAEQIQQRHSAAQLPERPVFDTEV